MISEINSQCPFDIPGLFWREGRFSISEATSMTTSADPLGRMDITLPDDLISAVPKRRSEFLAGRICAGLALRAAGQPIYVGRDGRKPIWPSGIAGSISHTHGRAMAAVSLTHSAIGLDCETIMADALAQKLQAELISPIEADLRPPSLPFATFLTLVFSGKEAVYKALSSQLDTVPAFLDANLVKITADSMQINLQDQILTVQHKLTQTECVTLVAFGK